MDSTSVNGYYYQQQQQHGNGSEESNYWTQGYAGQMVEDDDIEEGEACGDGSKYDPDVALSYLDLKLQNVLGHFQKEFEGGVSADKLGSKFGGYGSFLPTQERSPSVLAQPKTTAMVQNYNLQKSSNEGAAEHIQQKATGSVSAVQSTKLVGLANKNPSGSGALPSDFADECLAAVNAVKANELPPVKIPSVVNDVKGSNLKKLKLRFKVASDSVSRQKNTAIYSGLGLDHSSSPSLEDSPDKIDKYSTEADSRLDLSPLSIIRIITSHHIPGSRLLSPLQDSLLDLLQLKEEPCRKSGTAWTGITKIRDGPSSMDCSVSEFKELTRQTGKDDMTGAKNVNFKEQDSELCGDTAKKVKKDMEINNRRSKDYDPCLLKFTSKSPIKETCQERSETGIACASEKASLRGICSMTEAPKSRMKDNGFKSCLLSEAHKETGVSRDPKRHGKTDGGLMAKNGNEIHKEQRLDQLMEDTKEIVHKDFVFDVRKRGKESLKSQKKIGLSKDSTLLCKEKNGHKDETKGTPKEKVPGRVVIRESADAQKQHGKEVCSENKIRQKEMGMSKAVLKEKTKNVLKEMHKESRKEIYEKDPLLRETFDEDVMRNKEVTKATGKESYKYGAKVSRKDSVDVAKGITVTHQKETLKRASSDSFEREPCRVVEREKDRNVTKESLSKHLEHVSTSKVHASSSVASQPLPVQTTDGDAGLAPAAPVLIKEVWVGCDACQKWRLLPYGVKDTSLPKKWLCHMIYWLPGMNRCDVSEEDATQAHYALYGQPPGQIQVETNQGQSLLPAAPVSMSTVDINQAEQSQEPKSLKLGTKCGIGKKGQVRKSIPRSSNTVKLSGSIVKKNEPVCVKGRNNDVQLPLHEAEGSIGLSHLPDEVNIKGAKDVKYKQREKGKTNQIFQGPDTEVAHACPLKVKRRREDESKEYKSAKKAKAEECKGHNTEAGDSATFKIKSMESESKKHKDVKMAKSKDMKSTGGDSFEENESVDRGCASRNNIEPVKLSGGKVQKCKDVPKRLKNETSDCSLAADGKLKHQQQACLGTYNTGTYAGCDTGKSDKKDHSTKKRKLKEWKDSQTYQQGLSRKEEIQTECRREIISKTEKTDSSAHKVDSKDGKKQRANKSLSSKQGLLLDEIEEKSRGGLDEEHEIGQSRVHGIIHRVSDGTDSRKRDSGRRPLFASATSSSSKVSCYPKTVSALQDVRGSPIESTVSSSPVRSFKVGKLSLARSDSMGMDDLMDSRKPSPRRCSVGEADAQSDHSGLRGRVVSNMVRAIGDSGGRDGKQFSNNKTKDKNIHKKQCMGSHDAENFAAEHNLHFANDNQPVRCFKEMRVPDGSQEECSDHNIMDASQQRRGGREKSLSGQERERMKSYHDKRADKLHGDARDSYGKHNVSDGNACSERVLSGHHEAHSVCSRELYDDKPVCKVVKEQRDCMASNGKQELRSKTSDTAIKGDQLRQNMDGNKEILHFSSHDSHAKRHMDSISRQGKTVVSCCKDGKPSSRKSLQQGPFVAEKASNRSLSGRNVLSEIASVKVKPKPSSHSANMCEVQGNGTAVEILLSKGSQLQGTTYEASSGESLRAPRDSSAAGNGRPPVSNGLVGRDVEGAVASTIKKESLQTTANAALKEATDLKHKADRLKNIGGDELGSTSLYFRASLKFLHGASILEPCNADGLKHGETQSMAVYADTAKLCEFCAIAYERNKEMAAAALAYKCMGVAHMRVVVAKNALISRDRHELQVAAQMFLPGESPSSSASDIDNLNNHVLMDRDISINQAKGVGSLQVAGNHVIVARLRPHFARLLQYTQDVNAAIEAFAKAESAFIAASDSNYGSEEISAVKRAIDFNFYDIDGLLRLVLLAMEAVDH